MTTVKILQIDPWHKVYGQLTHELAMRLLDGLSTMGDSTDEVAIQFISRLWAKDSNELLLAAIDPTGHIKGFAAAAIQDPGQVWFLQPRLDEPTENDAVAEMVEQIEKWAQSKNVPMLTLIARRVDNKWMKRFGFEVSRYILQKEVRQ